MTKEDIVNHADQFTNPTIPSSHVRKSSSTSVSDCSNAESDSVRKPIPVASLPIPKGSTPYALAKQAEYQDRDLDRAEYYYKLAISQGERVISAIKDLASLMHQRGKTRQACDFLNRHRYLFRSDFHRFENLYKTLEKQLSASENMKNKSLKISKLAANDGETEVRSLFSNPIRIQKLDFGKELVDGKIVYYCIARFNSHSSARKTLEGFHQWDRFKVEWISLSGQLAGDAHYAKQKMEEHRKNNPTFCYSLFERDPEGYVLCLPVDSIDLELKRQASGQENTAKELLGTNLFTAIFSERV
jgi:hypothetical protein